MPRRAAGVSRREGRESGKESGLAMTRSLCFSLASDGVLGRAATMESAVLEVLGIPDDYADDAVQTIAEQVFLSGAMEGRARAGAHGGPVRITWAALIEKGMAIGVLEEQDA
jgi:hypothetical protein